MAGALDLTIAMPGLPSLTVALSRLRTEIRDWTTFWRDHFAPGFYRLMLETFVLEGGNTGASWAPLSPAYAAWKARLFWGNGILVLSGALKASLLSAEAPQAIFRASGTDLEVGTSVRYAGFHQYGTRRMPQRPPLRVNEAFMGVVGKQLQLYIQAAWQRAKDASQGEAA